MKKLRPSKKRGHEEKEGVLSYHSFSFDTYYDPEYLSYRSLRVLNEELLHGGKLLTEQLHKDVELMTYVLKGSLKYKDNFGTEMVIQENEMLLVTAGTGVLHSESNFSPSEPVHFLQAWFTPNQNGLQPHLEKKGFPVAAKWGQWCLMASQNGREGSLRIHQDVDIYSTYLEKGFEVTFETLSDRYYWIQILSGRFLIEKQILHKGDALALNNELLITISCLDDGELLLIDQS